MKKILLITILVLSMAYDALAYTNGDFQIWNTNDQDVTIGKSTKFSLEEEYRYGNSGSTLFYQHYDWGFSWAFDKRLEIATGYRLILEKAKYKWVEGDEPYVMLTGKTDLWKFKIDDRNRIEYRHSRFAPDHVKYRNRFTLKYPFEFKTITIAPYTSNEIFISSNATGYSQNRFDSGVEFTLTKYIKCSVSYMQQQVRIQYDKWRKANVLCFKTRISF